MSFSEKLKNARREKDLSQEQLAELLNVSRQAVSKWEQDNGYPETEKLIQLAKTLDVSLDSLLLDSGKQQEGETNNKNRFFSSERKITIKSFDGETVSSYYKFNIINNTFRSKKEAPCILCGTDKSSFWGDNSVTLGYYRTKNDAQRELNDIFKAMENGEAAYELKYNAKVKSRVLWVELVE